MEAHVQREAPEKFFRARSLFWLYKNNYSRFRERFNRDGNTVLLWSVSCLLFFTVTSGDLEGAEHHGDPPCPAIFL